MKASMKLDENQHHKTTTDPPPLLLRAKIPLTIFNQPFLSHFSTTTTHPSNLQLSLSTNFHSCPSLKFTYSTNPNSTSPFSLSLKSGTGIFGSPNHSPLVISAHFSFNPSNFNYPNPTFSLLLKPQLGSFSVRKTIFSNPKTSNVSNIDNVDESVVGEGDRGELNTNGFAFVALDNDRDRGVEKEYENSIMKGVEGMVVNADTKMGIGKRVGLNFRWRMDLRADRMPVLRVNKVGIERVEDVVVKKEDETKREESGASKSEVEMMKGMCLWMGKELDGLKRVNREMKCELAEIKMGRVGNDGSDVGRKKASGFEQWKKKKKDGGGGDESGSLSKKKDESKSDVEGELERAIKAASGS